MNTAGSGGYTLVLGGGAHLGAIQAGQLLALAEAGIEVRRIIGCSIGALNGAWMARGLSTTRANELISMWQDATSEPLFDKGWRRAVRMVTQQPALSSNARVRELARLACPASVLENFPIPTEIVTTNLTTGSVEYHSCGDAVEIVVASCAMPGVFDPVVIDGEQHVDGGVLDVLPWRRAGGEAALVLDCRAGQGWTANEAETALGVLLSSFALARHHRAYDGIETAGNIAVLPAPTNISEITLKSAGTSIEAAHQLTTNWIAGGGLERLHARMWNAGGDGPYTGNDDVNDGGAGRRFWRRRLPRARRSEQSFT